MTSSQLHIDLHAITDNYRLLDRHTGADTATAAAVKADGYGLGMNYIQSAVSGRVPNVFYRPAGRGGNASHCPDRQGYDLCQHRGEGFDQPDLPDYTAHQLTPVINHGQQAEMLAAYQRQTQVVLPAILHIDTGMNRLGFGKDTRSLLADKDSGLREIELQLVMSHLACSDDPSDDYNRYQLEQFTQLIQPFAHIPKSLCNSGGFFCPLIIIFSLPALASRFMGPCQTRQHQTARCDRFCPGRPISFKFAPFRQESVQVMVGEFIARTPTRLATIAAGYADGYARALYQPDRGQIATVEIAGKIVPLASVFPWMFLSQM